MRKISFYLRLWNYSDGLTKLWGGTNSGTDLVDGGEMGTCLAEVVMAG